MIAWGERRVGERTMEVDAGMPDDSTGPGLVMSLEPVVPDVVQIPETLGGGQRRVRQVIRAACPKELQHGDVTHYILEGGDIDVAECGACGEFIWYRGREK